jgi:hypothetical protein
LANEVGRQSDEIRFEPKPTVSLMRDPSHCRVNLLIAWMAVLILTACNGSYGRLQRSSDVSRTFERHEILPDHRYYATGPEARPTAILALHRSHTLTPGLWRSVEMTPERLARLVDAMTDQLGFTPAIMGAVITDPEGRPVGSWYSLYSHVTVRFEPDNVIAVSLPSQQADPLLKGRPFRPGIRR